MRQSQNFSSKPGYSGPELDLHYLGFFPARQGVYFLYLRLGDLLQAGVRPLGVVLRDVAGLLHLVDPVQLVAGRLAGRHPGALRLLPAGLYGPAPTRVPICSPRTTRSMLRGVRRLKATMGTSLSMQSVSAVLSITSMPRLRTSR